jgi:hypothetical protein
MASSLTARNLRPIGTGGSGAATLLLLGSLVLASAIPAGAQQGPSLQKSKPRASAANAQQPPVAAQPTAPLNLMDQPAIPATVVHHDDVLAVSANNSSLTQILHQVARETGMQIDGLSGDERVFGSFGPGNPRDVLVSLLNGTSYNVLMIGDLANGAPRQLLLTHKNGSALASAGNQPPQQPKPAADSDDVDDNPPDNDAPQPQPEEDVTQQPPGAGDNAPASPDMPRTPQQMLEQMQQMHDSEPPQADAPADAPPQ